MKYLHHLIKNNPRTFCHVCECNTYILPEHVDITWTHSQEISRITLLTECRNGHKTNLVYNFVSRIIHYDPMPDYQDVIFDPDSHYWEDNAISEITEELLNWLYQSRNWGPLLDIIKNHQWTIKDTSNAS